MSHFNIKSLGFYALAIGSVVILFKVVSAYGETLKAPPAIEGRYRLISKSLPKCLQSSDLLLNIQQSGIYLNGSLLALDKNPDSPKVSASHAKLEENYSLNGRWNDQKLELSGAIHELGSCGKRTDIKIQAVVNGDAINGEISINSAPKKVTFTAKKEAKQIEKTKENH